MLAIPSIFLDFVAFYLINSNFYLFFALLSQHRCIKFEQFKVFKFKVLVFISFFFFENVCVGFSFLFLIKNMRIKRWILHGTSYTKLLITYFISHCVITFGPKQMYFWWIFCSNIILVIKVITTYYSLKNKLETYCLE